MAAIHSKVAAGAWSGAGGVALGPLVAYLLEWWGAPPMGDVAASAAGAALVWAMNFLAAYAKRETVYRPNPIRSGGAMQERR